jgi:hypothetical protein
LLDQFDVIECFGRPGKDLRVGEITKKQKELYNILGVAPPPSYELVGVQDTHPNL